MSLHIGRKEVKSLHLGNKKITSLHKGADLIYQDSAALYAFKFTVNTARMTSRKMTLGHNSVYNGSTNVRPTWNVDWGDGSSETIGNIASVTHTYSANGSYQITILPGDFENGAPIPGWLSGFGMAASTQYGSDGTTAQAIISFDTVFPPNSFRICSNTGYSTATLRMFMYDTRYLTSIPDGFFESIDTSDLATSTRYFSGFAYAFGYCGYNTSLRIVDKAAPLIKRILAAKAVSPNGSTGYEFFSNTFIATKATNIPSGLFSDLRTRTNEAFGGIFNGTFASCKVLGTGDNTVLPNIFPATHTWKDYNGTFQYTFSNMTGVTALSNDFSFGTISVYSNSNSRVFGSTFLNVPITNIPSGLFVFDGALGRNVTQLFSNTFQGTKITSIPANLFSGIDWSNVTDATGLFDGTFRDITTLTEIPSTLFSGVNCAPTSCPGMFQYTFRGSCTTSPTATIPAGLFSTINTSNSTNLTRMFTGTFKMSCTANTSATIPSGLFNNIRLTNATQIGNMFTSTFYSYGTASTVMEIPTGLFSTIDTSAITDMSTTASVSISSLDTEEQSMPGGLYARAFANAPVTTIPSDLFSAFSTASCTKMSNVFNGTFSNTPITSIPSTLFSTVDTSNCTTANSLFASTFFRNSSSTISSSYAIPTGLFSAVDLSSATNVSSIFSYTFGGNRLTSIPAGLFGGLNIQSGATVATAFGNTFRNLWGNVTTSTLQQLPIADIFDGMSDFSWATAANANSVFNYTFGKSGSTTGAALSGAANTILQHFNFTPSSRSYMFNSQTALTDYSTINDNWK